MRKEVAILCLASVFLFSISSIAANKVVVVPLISKVAEPAPATSKLIFVTKGKWPGNLGGLSGADDKCNADALARNFTGTFQAVLGSIVGYTNLDPWRRSIHYPLPYLREDGEDLQSDFHDLFASGPDSSVTTDAQYNPWTGLNTDGTTHTEHCNGWSDSTTDYNGVVGDTVSGGLGGKWLNSFIAPCNTPRPLYCIEQ